MEGKPNTTENTTKTEDKNDTVWAEGVTKLQTNVSEH